MFLLFLLHALDLSQSLSLRKPLLAITLWNGPDACAGISEGTLHSLHSMFTMHSSGRVTIKHIVQVTECIINSNEIAITYLICVWVQATVIDFMTYK